jgi:hypothetical protein
MGLDEALGDIEAENPAAAMLWPWLIPYFDDWGRADASPRRIKGKIFPLFDSITLELIEEALTLFARHGLVKTYTGGDGKAYMYVPPDKWFRYQSHIHASKRTEDKSHCPAPPPESSQKARQHTAETRENPREELQLSRDSAQSRETPRDIAENRASPSPSPSVTLHTPQTPHGGAESEEGEEDQPDTASPSEEDSGVNITASAHDEPGSSQQNRTRSRPSRADADAMLRTLMVGFRRARYPGKDTAFHETIPAAEFKAVRSVLNSLADSGATDADVEQATSAAMRRFREVNMVTLPAIAKHWTALMEPYQAGDSSPQQQGNRMHVASNAVSNPYPFANKL